MEKLYIENWKAPLHDLQTFVLILDIVYHGTQHSEPYCVIIIILISINKNRLKFNLHKKYT